MNLNGLLLGSLGILIVATVAAAGVVVWDRFAVRAWERRQGQPVEASLEELMQPGDDCAMATDGAGVPFLIPGCTCPWNNGYHRRSDYSFEHYRNCPLAEPAPTLREETLDIPAAVPLVPLERLYDAGGTVKLGRNLLHEHCLYLRREGRRDEICGDCRPSLVGYAADLPQRTEP